MIDHSDLLKLLKRTVIDKVVDVTEDNFDWHYSIIGRIKKWVHEKSKCSNKVIIVIKVIKVL